MTFQEACVIKSKKLPAVALTDSLDYDWRYGQARRWSAEYHGDCNAVEKAFTDTMKQIGPPAETCRCLLGKGLIDTQHRLGKYQNPGLSKSMIFFNYQITGTVFIYKRTFGEVPVLPSTTLEYTEEIKTRNIDLICGPRTFGDILADNTNIKKTHTTLLFLLLCAVRARTVQVSGEKHHPILVLLPSYNVLKR